MISRLRSAWSRHPVLTACFMIAASLTIVLAIRNTIFLTHINDPEYQNPPIEDWMTPRYIVHSWQLAPEDVIIIIGKGPMPSKRHTLAEIAEDRNIPIEILILNLTKALEARMSARQ